MSSRSMMAQLGRKVNEGQMSLESAVVMAVAVLGHEECPRPLRAENMALYRAIMAAKTAKSAAEQAAILAEAGRVMEAKRLRKLAAEKAAAAARRERQQASDQARKAMAERKARRESSIIKGGMSVQKLMLALIKAGVSAIDAGKEAWKCFRMRCFSKAAMAAIMA